MCFYNFIYLDFILFCFILGLKLFVRVKKNTPKNEIYNKKVTPSFAVFYK